MSGPSRKYYEKELDRVYSLYIRKRFANIYGVVTCCTCPRQVHYTEITCGHNRKRRHMSTRWHEHNALGQCGQCNSIDKDMSKAIDERFGEGTALQMEQLSHTDTKHTIADLKALIAKFTEQLPC